jgi:hypothetical protein
MAELLEREVIGLNLVRAYNNLYTVTPETVFSSAMLHLHKNHKTMAWYVFRGRKFLVRKNKFVSTIMNNHEIGGYELEVDCVQAPGYEPYCITHKTIYGTLLKETVDEFICESISLWFPKERMNSRYLFPLGGVKWSQTRAGY